MSHHMLQDGQRQTSGGSSKEGDGGQQVTTWNSETSRGSGGKMKSMKAGRSSSSAGSPGSPGRPDSPSSVFSAGPRRSMTMGSDVMSGDAAKKRGSIVAMGNFQKLESDEKLSVKSGLGLLARARARMAQFVKRGYISNFMALVVLLDALLTATDIDSRAAGRTTPDIVKTLSEICLFLYTAELFMVLAVVGLHALRDWMVVLDAAIVICGYVELALTRLSGGGDLANSLGTLRVLRLARIVRLMNLLRKSRSLKELQKLVIMLTTCMKALAWSFLFCFVIMTIWAMMIVEIVHPFVKELSESGEFADCQQCVKATGSVMDANLLLFKTVIAGDSWGQIAVPVINYHPETFIIFVGSSLTLVFGVLNLIVAVVVDTFAEVRESDVLNLAQELDHNLEIDKKILQKIFERLDVKQKGELSLDELLEGARKDAEFQSRLRVMDIDEVDLRQLFEMIDVDGSGAIEAEEFVVPLSRWVHDSKTAPRFIKYNLMHTMHQQDELLELARFNFSLMSQRLDELTALLDQTQSMCSSFSTGVKMIERKSNSLLPQPPGKPAESSEVADAVEQPRPSKIPPSLPLPTSNLDSALESAMTALKESLSRAVHISLGEVEGILQTRFEELSRSLDASSRPPAVTPQRISLQQQDLKPLPAAPESGEDRSKTCQETRQHNAYVDDVRRTYNPVGARTSSTKPPDERSRFQSV